MTDVKKSITAVPPPVPPKPETVEEKYIFNNKLYNLTLSEKILSFKNTEPSRTKLWSGWNIPITVDNSIYKSMKGNFFMVRKYTDQILIYDMSDQELKDLLIKKNKLEFLEKIWTNGLEEFEEV